MKILFQSTVAWIPHNVLSWGYTLRLAGAHVTMHQPVCTDKSLCVDGKTVAHAGLETLLALLACWRLNCAVLNCTVLHASLLEIVFDDTRLKICTNRYRHYRKLRPRNIPTEKKRSLWQFEQLQIPHVYVWIFEFYLCLCHSFW